AQILDQISDSVIPGVSTGQLDRLCHQMIMDAGATPAPLNYRGFPKSICTSVNHVVCHGIPDDRKILHEGDVLNIDVTVILDGWHGDTSRMYFVGEKIPLKARKLVKITWDAMMLGIEQCRPGAHFGDIGAAIQQLGEAHHYSIVRDFCGHGLGRVFHDAPNVLHYGKAGTGPVMREGMFFTVEPMLNLGGHAVRILSDGWTAITCDRQLSAQFEHSIGVTATGYEIFTLSPKGYSAPDVFLQ
ncbi:MAG: type I methionyl aminopeptidase, partial [Pseudomonadota bacterium]